MKLKKFLAVIILFLLITLASCAVGEVEENTDVGSDIECRIIACDARKDDVLDEIALTGKEAEELLVYFTHSEYDEAVDSIMFPRSFTVSFYTYDENGECVPMYDSDGVLNEFFVQDTDTVYSNTVLMGNLPGAYEKLFGYIIEKGSSGGYFCNIYQSKTLHAVTRSSGESARNMYQTLTESTYQTDIDRTTVEKEYIILGFWGAESTEYYIYSDDYVEVFNSQSTTSLYEPKGTLTGIYQKAVDMYIGALQRVTEDDKAAGYKLNSLGILGSGAQVPALTDFSDIGCIFVEEYYTSETAPGEIAYNIFLYFESCSPEELEEKIAILEAREDVTAAAKISVKTYDNPAYD